MTRALPLPDGRYVVPGNRWDLLDDVTPRAVPTVSVVVPYYDAQDRLDRVLAGLSVQTHPHTHLEVVVADDGSPAAPDVGAAQDLGVRVVRQADRGFRAAAARNLGVAHSDGEVLCFLDADTVPEPGYVAALTRLPALCPDALTTGRRRHAELTGWSVPDVRAWLGGERPPPVELPEPGWLSDLHRRTADLLRIDATSYQAVISAVLACSRELFEEVGGFDATMVGYGGEDWDVAHRMLCAGAVLAHVPDAVAWHDGPDWSGRQDEATRQAEKAAERARLAARIPGADGGPADVLVHPLDHDVRRALAAAGVASAPLGGSPGARYLAEADGPVPPLDWPDVLSRVSYSGPDRLVVRHGGGTVTVTTTRAHRRTTRWASVLGPAESSADLFETTTLDLATARAGRSETPPCP